MSLLFCATALWVLAFSFAALAQAEPVPYDFGDAPDVPYPTADAQDWVRHHLADAYWLGGNASYAVSPRFVDTLDDATFRFGIDPNGDPYFDTDITTSANTPTRTAFLNVLVDEEARSCFQIDPFAWTQPGNHVVRNQRLELVPGTTQVYRVPAEHFVNNFVLGWIRLTLSERPVNVVPPETWDGSEDLAFLLGETEDHCGVPHFAPLLSPPALPEQEGVPQDAECDCFQRALSLLRNHVSVLQQVDVALDELLEPFWSQLRSAPDFDAALSHLAAAIAQANTFVDEAARFAEQCAEAETIRTGAETLAEKILEIQTDILNAQDVCRLCDSELSYGGQRVLGVSVELSGSIPAKRR